MHPQIFYESLKDLKFMELCSIDSMACGLLLDKCFADYNDLSKYRSHIEFEGDVYFSCLRFFCKGIHLHRCKKASYFCKIHIGVSFCYSPKICWCMHVFLIFEPDVEFGIEFHLGSIPK